MTFSTAFNSTPIIFAQNQICGDTASSQNRLWIYSLVVSCGFMVFMVSKKPFLTCLTTSRLKKSFDLRILRPRFAELSGNGCAVGHQRTLGGGPCSGSWKVCPCVAMGSDCYSTIYIHTTHGFSGLDRELSVGIAFCNHYRAPSNPYNPRRCDCCRASIGTVSQELGAPKSRPWSFGSWPGVDL